VVPWKVWDGTETFFVALAGRTYGPRRVTANASVRPALSMERCPFLCHPERSRGICSSADLSWKRVSLLVVETIKAIVGLRPSFSAHVRLSERGAPVQFPSGSVWVFRLTAERLFDCYCEVVGVEGMFFEARAVANSTVLAGAFMSVSGRLLP
jgi:hypothetical protein